MTSPHARFLHLMSSRPVILAPMEDVSDAGFRRLCRSHGAEACVTEFVRAERLISGERHALRKIAFAGDDSPTAIQIYGPDATLLAEAARIAEAAGPAWIDINCGCWVPRVSRKGAGAGWLRDPAAMVEMARLIVGTVALPVTVKTRIGWGPESEMPIVDLARRLEDTGIAALTIHCRTAQMGYTGNADWAWARRAREVVSIPVIVNGDVASADDVVRALDETGCAGVMVGRAAITYPWIFREARALLDRGVRLAPATDGDRVELYRTLLSLNVDSRGEHHGVQVTRRHARGLLGGIVAPSVIQSLLTCDSLARTLDLLGGERRSSSRPQRSEINAQG